MAYTCGMMNGLYGGYGSGIMVLSWLTWLLAAGLMTAGIYWLIKSANKRK
jgi:hypothetical protein